MMDVDCGSARDRLGQTLGGRYLLKEVLGAGGTAVVYRASGPDGEGYAVKILHDHLSRSEEVCRRFVREGQLGNVLDHPGTVRVLDHGSSEDGSPYLVLELLEGESLEEMRVRCGGRLPLAETLELCAQLLAVLEIAHAKNIVHRDIKPSNLFITTEGHLKVLDFGIARLVDDTSATATKTGQMVGTPAFMPPEQALSRPRDVDARTDIWSVGATLFTMLSGEHVHIAETSSEHLVKAATLHARSLARALPGVPSNVEAFVARCLSFDKTERWSSAASMRAELAVVRANPGRAIGTSTSPPPDRMPSSANMPTVVTGKPQNRPSPVPEERGSDLDAGMSLTTNPGVYELVRARRRWLLPFAVASSVLLVAMSIVVLVLVTRTPTPSQATAPAAQQTRTGAEGQGDGVPTNVAAPIDSGTAPASPTSAPVASYAPGVRSAPSSGSPSKPPVAVAARSSAASVKKPASTPSARKDVYRPF